MEEYTNKLESRERKREIQKTQKSLRSQPHILKTVEKPSIIFCYY